MDTIDAARRGALAALAGWAARRERLSEDRADLLAAAWWSGTRNIAELARTTDTARDTVYNDLRARGIDPTDRFASQPQPLPRYEPLRSAAVHEVAGLVEQVVRPAMLAETPDPLARAAWQMSIALSRIAGLADDDQADRHAELAEDFTDRLQNALREAHAHWARLHSPDQLAARTFARDILALGDQAVVEDATLTLVLPGGQTLTVRLTETGHDSPSEGWTLVSTDSPLLEPDLTGADHLAIRTAFDTIAEVLTAYLTEEAFEDS